MSVETTLGLTPSRRRITWARWDAAAMRTRISHPYVWVVVEPDGYERYFDTYAQARVWVDDYIVEMAS